jgi:hypothetical protein
MCITNEFPEKRIWDEGLAIVQQTLSHTVQKGNKGDALEAAWCIIKSSACYLCSLSNAAATIIPMGNILWAKTKRRSWIIWLEKALRVIPEFARADCECVRRGQAGSFFLPPEKVQYLQECPGQESSVCVERAHKNITNTYKNWQKDAQCLSLAGDGPRALLLKRKLQAASSASYPSCCGDIDWAQTHTAQRESQPRERAKLASSYVSVCVCTNFCRYQIFIKMKSFYVGLPFRRTAESFIIRPVKWSFLTHTRAPAQTALSSTPRGNLKLHQNAARNQQSLYVSDWLNSLTI